MVDESYLQLLAESIGGNSKEELLANCEDLLFNMFGEDPNQVDDPIEQLKICIANSRRLNKVRDARRWLELMVERGDPDAVALSKEYDDYVDAVFEEFVKDDEDVSE